MAILDVGDNSDLVASSAAGYYRLLSGRSTPVIHQLLHTYRIDRRAMALGAIRKLELAEQGVVVLAYACDAAWRLLPFIADSSYAGTWERVSLDFWAENEFAVLEESLRLLGGPQKDVVVNLLRTLERKGVPVDRYIK